VVNPRVVSAAAVALRSHGIAHMKKPGPSGGVAGCVMVWTGIRIVPAANLVSGRRGVGEGEEASRCSGILSTGWCPESRVAGVPLGCSTKGGSSEK
jgi:hypothetical protein